jgi:hypothetical protein
MELGFQFNVDAGNLPIFIGFICVMVMVVVLFVSAKTVIGKIVNKKKEENDDFFKLLESSGEDGRNEE